MSARPPSPADGPPRLEYPLAYGFTVIGLAAEDFPEHVRRLVARFVEDLPAEGIRVRASAGGRYLSVSVPVRLTSEEQRLAVYRALREDGRVVFAL